MSWFYDYSHYSDEDWKYDLSDLEENRPICGNNFRVIFSNHSNYDKEAIRKEIEVNSYLRNLNLANYEMTAEVAFSKVSGIKYEKKVEYIKEGGRNDRVLMFDSPSDSGYQITLERGYAGVDFLNKILFYISRLNWMEILVYDNMRKLKNFYLFGIQGLVEYSLGDLNGSSSEVLIEKLVVSTTGIEQHQCYR